MKDVEACKRCGERIQLIVERVPYYRTRQVDIAVVHCMICGNTECAPALFSDRFADTAIERWNAQPNPFGMPGSTLSLINLNLNLLWKR